METSAGMMEMSVRIKGSMFERTLPAERRFHDRCQAESGVIGLFFVRIFYRQHQNQSNPVRESPVDGDEVS